MTYSHKKERRTKKTFHEGLFLAQQIAEQVAQEWQASDTPDWHGGMAAAREIARRLQEVGEKEERESHENDQNR